MDEKPQERGRLLEGMLNDLFRAYGIHVQENFVRRSPDSSAALEQIGGVIELNGLIHLVEMKWLKDPVGVGDFASPPGKGNEPSGRVRNLHLEQQVHRGSE